MGPSMIDAIDDVLPQTQCRQCGFDGCRAYAWSIVMDETPINRCATGGAAVIKQLAAITGREEIPLDPEYGEEVPLAVSFINPDLCIGCRKCVAYCPTGAIVGAPKRLHAVLTDWCTGCALCVIPCPIDCIEMRPAPFQWTRERAHQARERYHAKLEREKNREARRNARLAQESSAEKKKALLASILAQVKKNQ